MGKTAFIGFGEVNTPKKIIIKIFENKDAISKSEKFFISFHPQNR